MKKNKKNKIFKFIFMSFFMAFVVIYFSEITGYYEYQNYKKASLTHEQIQKFEEDIASGKEIDINQYLVVDNRKFDNNLSKLVSKISSGISKIVKGGVEYTFKYISKMIDE